MTGIQKMGNINKLCLVGLRLNFPINDNTKLINNKLKKTYLCYENTDDLCMKINPCNNNKYK